VGEIAHSFFTNTHLGLQLAWRAVTEPIKQLMPDRNRNLINRSELPLLTHIVFAETNDCLATVHGKKASLISMHEMVHKRSESGFTLLELVVTLGIVAVLVGLAVPSLQSWISDSEISSSTNAFVSSVQTARSTAVAQNTNVGMCPTDKPQDISVRCSTGVSWTEGWIVFVDTNGDGIRTNNEEELLLHMEERSPGFEIIVDEVYRDLIYFSANGTSITPVNIPITGSFTISYGSSENRVVTISANGHVRTETQ